MADRLVPLDGPANFRDIGGYETDHGRMVRTGRLFRADSLSYMSDADVLHVTEVLGLRTVVDLRASHEVERFTHGPLAELHVLPDDLAGLDTIELGCGTAYVSAWLMRRGARPVGIDNSPEQLATARRLQEAHGLQFPLHLGDAEATPFPDASFRSGNRTSTPENRKSARLDIAFPKLRVAATATGASAEVAGILELEPMCMHTTVAVSWQATKNGSQ